MKVSRKTRQKEIVKSEALKFQGFFSSEDLHVNIKDVSIGIATVYRILKEMRSNGELNSFMCNRRTVYSNKNRVHSHFICEKCEDTKHFNVKNIDFLKDEIQEEVNSVLIEVKGVCKECKKYI